MSLAVKKVPLTLSSLALYSGTCYTIEENRRKGIRTLQESIEKNYTAIRSRMEN